MVLPPSSAAVASPLAPAPAAAPSHLAVGGCGRGGGDGGSPLRPASGTRDDGGGLFVLGRRLNLPNRRRRGAGGSDHPLAGSIAGGGHSAASAHVLDARVLLRLPDDHGSYITVIDKGSVATAGVGTVVPSVIVQGTTRKIKLEKVLHVPLMGFNLMSVGMMEERGAEVSFKSGMCIIKINEKIAACGTRKNGLYHLEMAPMSDVAVVASL